MTEYFTWHRVSISEAPHRWLLLKAIVTLLLTISAIAGVRSWLPRPGNEAASVTASDRIPLKADFEATIFPVAEENVARFRAKCAECGVVESTREIVQILERMDSGAVSEVKRARLKEQVVKSISNYEVTVRMKDGASHQFMVTNPATWRTGERVIFIEGRNPLSE